MVEIHLSRYARRRAQLYGIPEHVILNIVRSRVFSPGTTTFVVKEKSFAYPLKIVVLREEAKLTIITNYPLKKGTSQ